MAKAKKTEAEMPIEEHLEEEAVEKSVDLEPKADNSEAFVARKLRLINEMENPVKAERLANRLIRNRK